MNLLFAEGLSFPPDGVSQKFAFLARSGAGKTYAAGRLVESMLEHGDQVIILDPVGVWWGLRLAADGKGGGFEIPVFGGDQGDVPLYPENGALVARTLVERNSSAVLDVSHFRKADRIRFMLAFAEEFFHQKKQHRSPVHLVIEEAQTFVPQFVPADMAKLVGAMEDLIKLGRNYGVGVSLISQRPQSVNKDVLNQTEVLVVLQTTGPQERKTIKGWIVEQGLDIQDLVDELPSLGRKKKGEAFVWSPSWLGVTKRVQVLKKQTYDASKTPTAAVRKRAAKALSTEELEALKTDMQAAVEKQKQEDPAELRKAVAAKDREIHSLLAAINEEREVWAAKEKKTQPMKLKVGVGKPLLSKREERWLKEIYDAARSIGKPFMRLEKILAKIEDPLFKWEATDKPVLMKPRSVPVVARLSPDNPLVGKYTPPKAPARPTMANFSDGDGSDPVTGGARRMLEVLARSSKALSREQLALLSDMSPQTGTFKTYLALLRRRSLIGESGGMFHSVPAGDALVPDAGQVVTTPDELRTMWRRKFTGGAGRMFDVLVKSQGSNLTREELANLAGMEPGTGTFKTYLALLRRAKVLDESSGQFALRSELCD